MHNTAKIIKNRKRCDYKGCPYLIPSNQKYCSEHPPGPHYEPFKDKVVKWLFLQETKRGGRYHGRGTEKRKISYSNGNYKTRRLHGAE